MLWICPECGDHNDDAIIRCCCGFEDRNEETAYPPMVKAVAKIVTGLSENCQMVLLTGTSYGVIHGLYQAISYKEWETSLALMVLLPAAVGATFFGIILVFVWIVTLIGKLNPLKG